MRYHPVDSLEYKKEQKSSLENRKSVFLKLLDLGWLDKTTLDIENADEIAKILNAGTIA